MSAAILPEIRWRAIDEDANVIPGALLYAYAAGTDSPQDTYTTSDLDVANSNPVEADDGGLFPAIYLAESAGYKFVLTDADDVTIWEQDQVLDPGSYFASNFGAVMSAGSRNVTTGYTLLATDRLVTVASSGATVFNLLAASSFTSDVTIKNMSSGTVVITPNGSDTVDTNTTWTLEAAADPVFPCVTLRPVTGGWLIVSSHRAA